MSTAYGITDFTAIFIWAPVFFNAMIYLNDTDKWPIQVVLNQFVVQNSDLNTIQNPDRPPPPAQAVQMAVIVLAIVVLYAVMPSGGDGTAPAQDSGNPHAIDQD